MVLNAIQYHNGLSCGTYSLCSPIVGDTYINAMNDTRFFKGVVLVQKYIEYIYVNIRDSS